MGPLTNFWILSCFLAPIVIAIPPSANLVSVVVVNFLNAYRGEVFPNYNLTGDIPSDVNKLASEIHQLSTGLQSDISKWRLNSVNTLYHKELSAWAEVIHFQHKIYSDAKSEVSQSPMAENFFNVDALEKQLANSSEVIKVYLKDAADKIEEELPGCDTRLAKQLMWNEIFDLAFLFLEGHQILQMSMLRMDKHYNERGKPQLHPDRLNLEDRMMKNFEQLKINFQHLDEYGLGQLRRFNAAWGCNLTDTKHSVYLQEYGKKNVDKKICLHPFNVEFDYGVVTVAKLVELDNTLYLKPLIASFASNVNQILEYPHLAWQFWNDSPNCREPYLYDVQENSSIILGDIYVPGQVVTGFQLKVRKGPEPWPELYLVVVSRIMDESLRKNATMYEERYKEELLEQRKTTVIEAGSPVYPGKTIFYYSYLKPDLSAEKIANEISPSLSKSDPKPVKVEPGTRVLFKESSLDREGSSRLLPPIDTQMIVRAPQRPFSGAGFMLLRGDENTSGYVALKLLHADPKDDVDNLLFAKMATKNVFELHEWMQQRTHT